MASNIYFARNSRPDNAFQKTLKHLKLRGQLLARRGLQSRPIFLAVLAVVALAVVLATWFVFWTDEPGRPAHPARGAGSALAAAAEAAAKAGSEPGFERFEPDPMATAQPKSGAALRKGLDRTGPFSRRRVVVLGSEDGRINTGVWPGWGPERESVLNWAAAGVRVQKYCPFQCTITHDQSLITSADAVVMETVNHPKFLGSNTDVPLTYPERTRDNPRAATMDVTESGLAVPPRLPVTGAFYYEPESYYPRHNMRDDGVRGAMDFSMTHRADATLPVTLVCPWGRKHEAYLDPAPAKTPGRLIAYFSEHGVGPFGRLIDELFDAAGDGIHAYITKRNRDTPAEAGGDPYQLSRRLDFVATYRFLLITEPTAEDDFLSPEWSQALLAGTVPVYLGAPNIAAYAPGPRAFVDGRAFSTGADLWAYLKSFDADDAAKDEAARTRAARAYEWFFRWKQGAYAAYTADERGHKFAIGTGGGLDAPRDLAEVARVNSRWARPSLALADASADPADTRAFLEASMAGWRAFRRHLDNCVHYAECRLCQLVHTLT